MTETPRCPYCDSHKIKRRKGSLYECTSCENIWIIGTEVDDGNDT